MSERSTYLISDGDAGAPPSAFALALHSVLTAGLVIYGHSLWKLAVLQNNLGRERLPQNQNALKGQFGSSEAELCEVLVHSQCITYAPP